MDSSAYGQNTVDAHAFNRMIRHRNDLQVERRRLQYELDVISSQLEEANRRLRDLECAAKAPVSTSSSNSGWDRNTHDLFIKNLHQSSSSLKEGCNQLNMQRIALIQRIERLDQQIDSLSS